MMTMMDSASAVGFCTAVSGGCCSSVTIAKYRPFSSSDDSAGVHSAFRRLSHARCLDLPWNTSRRLIDHCSFTMRNSLHPRSRVRATEEYSGTNYHPSEEVAESKSQDGGDARLTAAETTRTLIEVNKEATLMFSALINDEAHENIFLPELPYMTDEHGNIYFRVDNDEGIVETLVSENNFVQVIIGLDTVEMLNEMDLSGQSDIDFGIEEITEGDGDDIEDEDEDEDEDDDDDEEDEDDYDKDLVAILEDEEDESDSDETLGDWAKLETMRSSHPMYFAVKLAEAASDLPMDWIDQPPAGLAILGLLRPAFVEEHPLIQKHISDNKSCKDGQNQVEKIDKLEGIGMLNGHHNESTSSKDGSVWEEGLEKAERVRPGTSFYKLEMIKIQLISSHGHQTVVEVNDFQKASPDAIAHSAAQIISRLKDGGEKITQGLKSLCWRCKGIKVEEVTVVGVDSLGFDLRVCSGTQVQNLRFAFNTRATSEYSAEMQLHDLLFPRVQQAQNWQQAHPKEF